MEEESFGFSSSFQRQDVPKGEGLHLYACFAFKWMCCLLKADKLNEILLWQALCRTRYVVLVIEGLLLLSSYRVYSALSCDSCLLTDFTFYNYKEYFIRVKEIKRIKFIDVIVICRCWSSITYSVYVGRNG